MTREPEEIKKALETAFEHTEVIEMLENGSASQRELIKDCREGLELLAGVD